MITTSAFLAGAIGIEIIKLVQIQVFFYKIFILFFRKQCHQTNKPYKIDMLIFLKISIDIHHLAMSDINYLKKIMKFYIKINSVIEIL